MKYFIAIGVVIAFISSCYYDNIDELHPAAAPCDTTSTVSFAQDILPIMIHSCGGQDASCHNSASTQSGYGLGNYADVLTSYNNNSVFLETITHSATINSSRWMPKGTTAKIDDCSIYKITAWIDAGLPQN